MFTRVERDVVFIDERAHHVCEVNRVRDVGMLVKDAHHVAEVADVHGDGVEFDIGVAGGGSGARRLHRRPRNDRRRRWGCRAQEIVHHALANEAEAAGYQEFHAH